MGKVNHGKQSTTMNQGCYTNHLNTETPKLWLVAVMSYYENTFACIWIKKIIKTGKVNKSPEDHCGHSVDMVADVCVTLYYW